MTGSLRRRLLGWLLLATAALGILALVDTWDEAVDVATGLSDRVLAGSALAIAERVTADEDQSLIVDIPYSALEMLSSTAQDRVFYRVDGPNGRLTGYEGLTPAPTGDDGIGYADGSFAGDPIRVITLDRSVSTGIGTIPFRVTVAESTLARRDLARTLLLRSALRLAAMIGGAALIVWIAVPLALRPLNRLGEAIAARSPDDLSPLTAAVPQEVQGLVEAVNSLMTRLDIALTALRNFTGNASHQLRTPLAVVRTELALAHRAASPARLQQALDRADAALAHAERVLAQLLLLARVDAAAGQAPGQELDLTALARDVTSEHIPRAAAAGIDLGFQAPGPSPDPVLPERQPLAPQTTGAQPYGLRSSDLQSSGQHPAELIPADRTSPVPPLAGLTAPDLVSPGLPHTVLPDTSLRDMDLPDLELSRLGLSKQEPGLPLPAHSDPPPQNESLRGPVPPGPAAPDPDVLQAGHQPPDNQIERYPAQASQPPAISAGDQYSTGTVFPHLAPGAQIPATRRPAPHAAGPQPERPPAAAGTPAALLIRAEPVLLAEALSNLIDNAILHTGPGTVVTVSVQRRDGEAILRVEDDGPGLPAGLHSPGGRFARGGSGEGLGLGLSVVSEIAALSGGSFRLTSASTGTGVCAELRLPLAPPGTAT